MACREGGLEWETAVGRRTAVWRTRMSSLASALATVMLPACRGSAGKHFRPGWLAGRGVLAHLTGLLDVSDELLLLLLHSALLAFQTPFALSEIPLLGCGWVH
jgi:hypothetical protein